LLVHRPGSFGDHYPTRRLVSKLQRTADDTLRQNSYTNRFSKLLQREQV